MTEKMSKWNKVGKEEDAILWSSLYLWLMITESLQKTIAIGSEFL